jgi:hypothetical protein
VFIQACIDVLDSKENGEVTTEQQDQLKAEIVNLAKKYC